MLAFPTQPGVEVYASDAGLICFKSEDFALGKDVVVCLTIGQFRKVIKNAEQLISQAEKCRAEVNNG